MSEEILETVNEEPIANTIVDDPDDIEDTVINEQNTDETTDTESDNAEATNEQDNQETEEPETRKEFAINQSTVTFDYNIRQMIIKLPYDRQSSIGVDMYYSNNYMVLMDYYLKDVSIKSESDSEIVGLKNWICGGQSTESAESVCEADFIPSRIMRPMYGILGFAGKTADKSDIIVTMNFR